MSSLGFAFIALVLVSLCAGDLTRQPRPAAGLLWVILFFSSVNALVRAFSKEEDARTADHLRLLATPTIVFAGKTLFNFLLLSFIGVLTMILFIILFGFPRPDVAGLFAGLLLPMPGLSALGTVLGAMLSRSQSRWAVFTIAAFPIFLPSLTASVEVLSRSLINGASTGPDLIFGLFSFSVGMVLIGGLLFTEIW
ncbi:MAG: heme exporter protein CcmB [Armatimonadota bacterium]|nr:heme exporter protein CcmB [Armatimonadota bacterium]